jgi:hypothetical protein
VRASVSGAGGGLSALPPGCESRVDVALDDAALLARAEEGAEIEPVLLGQPARQGRRAQL